MIATQINTVQITAIHWLAVGTGAALGAWLRWGLGLALGSSGFAMGTLIANLIGGFFIGCALAYFANTFAQNELRLFVTTGFLGGLTTFSAFSAEAFIFLQKQQYSWAAAHISSHVLGSLIMTAIGFSLVHYLRN
jgi:CrcB protein